MIDRFVAPAQTYPLSIFFKSSSVFAFPSVILLEFLLTRFILACGIICHHLL